MAAVTIKSGTVDATDFLSETPQGEWWTLLRARRSFVKTHLPYDCRQLLRFVDEAKLMCGPLGFADVFDLMRRGLEIDPDLVDWATEGLRTLSPDEPVALDAAVARGRAQALAADPDVKAMRTHAEAAAEQPREPSGRVTAKAVGNDITNGLRGTGSTYLVRRLKRDAPEVAEELARGELPSARAAAIKAGIVKVRTRVEIAFRLVERMSTAERLDFERQIRPLIQAAESAQ